MRFRALLAALSPKRASGQRNAINVAQIRRRAHRLRTEPPRPSLSRPTNFVLLIAQGGSACCLSPAPAARTRRQGQPANEWVHQHTMRDLNSESTASAAYYIRTVPVDAFKHRQAIAVDAPVPLSRLRDHGSRQLSLGIDCKRSARGKLHVKDP